MAKKSYLGVSEKARENRRLYTGKSGNVAGLVRRGYYGLGGVARPCWSRGETLTYYGTLEAAQSVRTNGAAAPAGRRCALFAGGELSQILAHVDAYDLNYTHSIPANLSTARTGLAGAGVGSYALFAGGTSNGTVVDAYNEQLSRSTATALRSGGAFPAGGSIGGYALFNGGQSHPCTDAYNASLTRSSAPDSASAHFNHACASTGEHLLFAGGYQNTYYSTISAVDAYDADLTRSTAGALSQTRGHLSGAGVGGYALFAGGYKDKSGGTTTAVVDAYNDTLTRSAAPALHSAKQSVGGGSLKGNALFVGGWTGSANVANAEAYNADLSKRSVTSISAAKGFLPSVTLEDSVFFFAAGTMEVYALM